MYNRKKHNERGMSLIELIIVFAIVGVFMIAVVPRGVEATQKSKSSALQEEFAGVVSAFSTLDNGTGSSVHAVKATITDTDGNLIIKDYIIPVAPSAAFGTVTNSEVFRHDGGKKPLVLKYGFNSITLTSEKTNYAGSYQHTGDLTATPVKFTSTTSTGNVVAVSLSAQGATGLSPIFSVQDSKLIEDFIMSPNGLDFAEIRSQMGDITDTEINKKILAALFGGSIENKDTNYIPYDESKTPVTTIYTTDIVKQPIQLTVADVESIKESSSGTTYKTLTDTSKGTLYEVTGLMSRADFITYMKKSALTTDETLLNTMYDKLAEGFPIGTPVFIPHREKDIIKSTTSDLKYGFYRP